MILVDSHAHLDFRQFDGDRDEVLARARDAGVGAIVTIGVDVASSRRAVELAEQKPMVYAAVGMHPHDARKLDGAALAELRDLARHPKVVAVGEIGLDFYRNLSPREAQQRAFQAQLAWATRLGKPVVIHDRDAHDEVMSALEGWAAGLRGSPLEGRAGVLHTFSGDAAMAKRAVAAGFYLSVSGPVTYPKSDALREIVRALPLERLLVETDCPFLAPQAHRGRRNEPGYVRLVAEQVAAVKGISLEALAEATTANAERLFQILQTLGVPRFTRPGKHRHQGQTPEVQDARETPEAEIG